MKPLAIFYLLVIYVILQFGWWAYLLADLYKEVFDLKYQLVQMSLSNGAEIEQEHNAFISSLRHKWMMIAGEGMVFLILLFIGIRMINKSFIKEIRLNEQQKNFMLSVTHEFKSPLAAIRLNLQTLQKHRLPETKQSEIVNNAILETDRVTNLVSNALIASQMESNVYTFDKNWINISQEIEAMLNKIPDAKKEFITIQSDIQPDVEWYGDKDGIHSVISNLLQNAEKYSSNGKAEVHIKLRKDQNKIQLSVADNGIGIPDSEKSNVLKPFYRIGNEDTRKTKGTGLGLYIVQFIVDAHKGKINIKDNTPSGIIFEINLPER